MKAVILAGGFGTRISEESAVRPKPMVEIGGRPILWHIMKIYAAHGITDFVICAGYKGHIIREYFANYYVNSSDVTFDLEHHSMVAHATTAEPWRVTIVDTGLDTMTGGRLRRARTYIGEEAFCLTYGDCVTDLDLTALVEFHRESGSLVTLTAIQPPGRFGALTLEPDRTTVSAFREKLPGDGSWVNGGFFVVEPAALDLIEGDETTWEAGPLETIAERGLLHAYKHSGYWQNLDSLRDKAVLEREWDSRAPRWKVW